MPPSLSPLPRQPELFGLNSIRFPFFRIHTQTRQNRLGYAAITNTPGPLDLQIIRDLFLAHATCPSQVSLIPDSRPEHCLEHPTVAEGKKKKKQLDMLTEQLNALSQKFYTPFMTLPKQKNQTMSSSYMPRRGD